MMRSGFKVSSLFFRSIRIGMQVAKYSETRRRGQGACARQASRSIKTGRAPPRRLPLGSEYAAQRPQPALETPGALPRGQRHAQKALLRLARHAEAVAVVDAHAGRAEPRLDLVGPSREVDGNPPEQRVGKPRRHAGKEAVEQVVRLHQEKALALDDLTCTPSQDELAHHLGVERRRLDVHVVHGMLDALPEALGAREERDAQAVRKRIGGLGDVHGALGRQVGEAGRDGTP